jgi:endo-1,4-beta-xylanase
MGMTRRRFVAQASATAAVLGGSIPLRAQAPPLRSLGEVAASRGMLSGCAVAVARLRDDAPYKELIRTQANIVVAENAFKFGPIHPTPTTYFFDDADYLAHFAETNGMKLRGHNFVWHRSLPAWFNGYVTPQNAEHVLTDHIERVAGHFAGRIHSWDVVNEAIAPQDNLPGGMRNSPWQQLLPQYLDIAYRTARRVDPKALLVYNDYGIEAEDADSAKKRAAVLTLLRGMQERNVPIDALGIQSHISAGSGAVYGEGLQRLIADASAMGLTVMLTEMDVNDRGLGPDIPGRDAAVSAAYSSYLRTALANPAVTALLTWGIADRYTWLNGEQSRADRLPERPLPFDRDLQPKSAFYAEVRAMTLAPSRS